MPPGARFLPRGRHVAGLACSPWSALLNFLIIAFVMFLVVKVYNRFRDREGSSGPPEDVLLLREIRDELRASRR